MASSAPPPPIVSGLRRDDAAYLHKLYQPAVVEQHANATVKFLDKFAAAIVSKKPEDEEGAKSIFKGALRARDALQQKYMAYVRTTLPAGSDTYLRLSEARSRLLAVNARGGGATATYSAPDYNEFLTRVFSRIAVTAVKYSEEFIGGGGGGSVVHAFAKDIDSVLKCMLPTPSTATSAASCCSSPLPPVAEVADEPSPSSVQSPTPPPPAADTFVDTKMEQPNFSSPSAQLDLVDW